MRRYLDLAAACVLMAVAIVLIIPYFICSWCLSRVTRLAARHG